MVLTDQQLTGLTIAIKRYKAGEKYTVISSLTKNFRTKINNSIITIFI